MFAAIAAALFPAGALCLAVGYVLLLTFSRSADPKLTLLDGLLQLETDAPPKSRYDHAA